MTVDQAEEIIYHYEYWEDKPCSCPMGNPPCGKCINCPSGEDYKKAVKIMWSK